MKQIYAATFFALLALGATSCQQQDILTEKTSVVASSINVEMAYPGQLGKPEEGHFFGEKVVYQAINNEKVFQGDMIITPVQNNPDLGVNGTGRTSAYSKWPNKTIPYTIDPALPNASRVAQAIAHWQANTPLKFVRRTTQADYVTFTTGTGCSSNVGRVGRQQFIRLGANCNVGNTIHEIGHAIGLWHEQTRKDRDTFLKVNWSNIVTGFENNYQTYRDMRMDGFETSGGMDYNSIMMYDSYSFSKNGQPTITKPDGSAFWGQRSRLSPKDIEAIRMMYP
jgi:hypothetical protein